MIGFGPFSSLEAIQELCAARPPPEARGQRRPIGLVAKSTLTPIICHKTAQAYRDVIRDLIKAGRWRDAMTMEIKDIRGKFGSKYNGAMLEMLKNARKRGLLGGK
jgi:hypothetical protein